MASIRQRPVDPTHLTTREKQLLRLICAGYLNKEIATILKLTQRTVEIYRANIMLKLDIDNLPGIVKYAIKNGISSIDEYRCFDHMISSGCNNKRQELNAGGRADRDDE